MLTLRLVITVSVRLFESDELSKRYFSGGVEPDGRGTNARLGGISDVLCEPPRCPTLYFVFSRQDGCADGDGKPLFPRHNIPSMVWHGRVH